MANKGFVIINRQIEDNEIWDTTEPFDKRSAWIDLILMANHADKKIVIGNQSLTIKRGEKFTSIRQLSIRWNWSKNKTLSYIRLLEDLGMIYRNKMLNGTLLTIVNYSKFQDMRDTNRDTDKDTNVATTMATTMATPMPQTTMINNDKTMNKTIKQKPAARFDGYE